MDFSHIEPLNKETPFEFGPIQTKWIEALESGNYTQTNGYLKTPQGYCCLGVLCEIAGLAESLDPAGVSRFTGPASGSSSTYVPMGSVDAFGLRSAAGAFSRLIAIDGNADLGTLASLNDHANLSFAQIAAYIRHDPHNVFSHAA